MRKDPLYHFILYVLLQERKGDIPFKIESLLFGRRRASVRCFARLFAGCDVATYRHYRDLFEKEHPEYSVGIGQINVMKDGQGLMTGHLKDH
mgnify:CR=1 FL=1